MKKKIWISVGVGLALLVGLCVFSVWQSRHGLRVTNYQVDTPLEEALRIVHLSDLHSMQFGEENAKLIEKVAAQQPDIIVMTGDMLSMDDTPAEAEALCRLVAAMDAIAPVYYALGNHELGYMQTYGEALLTQLEQAGAVVLEQRYEDVQIGSRRVRIGGAYGYLLSRDYRNGAEQDFMDEFLDTEHPTVLLAHMGEGLLEYHCLQDWDVTLVLSGHAHGGQIRLPLIGGLYDPEVGILPKYEKGLFYMEGSAAVVSAGLGTSVDIPRFCNPPELIVIDLQ